MSQAYESIGTPTPDIERVAARHEGWTDTPHNDLAHEFINNPFYAEYDQRTNTQALGLDGRLPADPHLTRMADHHETPVAAIVPQPW